MNDNKINEVIKNLRRCDQNYEESVSIYTFENAIEVIEQLRKERDEARREVCEFEEYCVEEANKRGWDCYKKGNTMSDLIKQIEELTLRCDSSTLLPIIERVEELLRNTEQLEATVARLTDNLRRMDAMVTLVYVSIEKRKLREETK
jgi:hypothetical protein